MTAPPNADGPLELARRRLDDAVHALAEPVPVWHSGVCRWVDPVVRPVARALTGRSGAAQRGVVFGSRAAVPQQCVGAARGRSTPPSGRGRPARQKRALDRLHQLPARGWRPQDCALIDDYCAQLDGGRSPRPSCSVTRRRRWRYACRARAALNGSCTEGTPAGSRCGRGR